MDSGEQKFRRSKSSGHTRPSIKAALAASSGALFALFLVSGIINLLMLTGSIFMLQVYDRVLASQSLPTLLVLAGIAGIAVIAYLFQGLLDILRGRTLTLIGERVDDEVGPAVHAAIVRQPLVSAGSPQENL